MHDDWHAGIGAFLQSHCDEGCADESQLVRVDGDDDRRVRFLRGFDGASQQHTAADIVGRHGEFVLARNCQQVPHIHEHLGNFFR